MWSGAGIYRNREDLQKTLSTFESLEQIHMRASVPEEFAECSIVKNMLTTARLIVISALTRQESRGAHVRTDITQTWDNTSSPFGHTHISQQGVSIEQKEVA
ncbi:MAG: fumarate reductase/succinate dehydrogenase flavoprotein subunit, partial [Methanospirillum sp.]|nr:fumarate reductase/succinate dehydrogenase flavoprotein subunit [Methanospirillum sp.]